jgi:dipeptidase E
VCWFEQCVTDSYGKELKPMNCLGILKGSNCPHYNSKGRRPAFHKYIKNTFISSGYAADNLAGLHFVDGIFYRAISSVKGAFGYKVENVNNKISETRLDTIHLSPKKTFMKYIGETETYSGLCK